MHAHTPAPLAVSETDAARMLGLAPRTLQAWRLSGTGPAYSRISSRCVRYRVDELERWLAERERTSTSDDATPRPAA